MDLTQILELLKTKSQTELLLIIKELVGREPDLIDQLELLVKVPLMSDQLSLAGHSSNHPVSTQKVEEETGIVEAEIRRQVTAAFFGDHKQGRSWVPPYEVYRELNHLHRIADKYAQAGQWNAAQTIYRSIVEEAISNYGHTQDEGDIMRAIIESTESLLQFYQKQTSLPQSERNPQAVSSQLLRTLYLAWRFDFSYGGYLSHLPALLVTHATQAEHQQLKEWLLADIRRGTDFSAKFHNRHLLRFLSQLKTAEGATFQELLDDYQRLGLYQDMALKLLEAGQWEQSRQLVREHLSEVAEVIEWAAKLIELGVTLQTGINFNEIAFEIVEEKLAECLESLTQEAANPGMAHNVERYRRWLAEHYTALGHPAQALQMQLARFKTNPQQETYEAVKEAVELPGQVEQEWSQLYPELIQTLKEQVRWDDLVKIYLSENQLHSAIEALGRLEAQRDRQGRVYYNVQSLIDRLLEVATAAEIILPDEAIRLYQQAAERLIGLRERKNYQGATKVLLKARKLCLEHGQEAKWQIYITGLREHNRQLRTLKEELDRSGL